ncbi:hypothetical protein [Paraburkholderia sp. DHOC27]|nr:hypothetical protein [Paraburkholderia sp. DHOC27]
MSQSTSATSATASTSLLGRLAAVARRALQLHLQTCAVLAEAHRRPH